MLGIRLSMVEGSTIESFQEELFKIYRGKKNKLTRKLLKSKLSYCNMRGTKDKKLEKSVVQMKQCLLNAVELAYIIDSIRNYKLLLENSIKEYETNDSSSSSGNLSGEHNLKMLHCLLKDRIIETYHKFQHSIDRVILDIRKSSKKLQDVCVLLAKVMMRRILYRVLLCQ